MHVNKSSNHNQYLVRIINDMNDGMTILDQHKASLDEYYALVEEPGQVNRVFASHVHFATRILISPIFL